MRESSPRVSSRPKHSRRDFLLSAGALAATAGAASNAAGAVEARTLPQIKIGKYSISRLICGCNPFGARSHTSPMIDLEFRQYYTLEQIAQTLRKCQEEGINTAQGINAERYRALVKGRGNNQTL